MNLSAEKRTALFQLVIKPQPQPVDEICTMELALDLQRQGLVHVNRKTETMRLSYLGEDVACDIAEIVKAGDPDEINCIRCGGDRYDCECWL